MNIRIFLTIAVGVILIAVAIHTLYRSPHNDVIVEKPKATANTANAPAPAPAPAEPPKAEVRPLTDKSGQQATMEDLKKVDTLKEILSSKNDNDPRLDSDFQNLSENAKHLMRAQYHAMRPESFNEKGTVVFLLGRNLKTPDDFKFLGDVLSEPPCLNMADCSKPPVHSPEESVHEDTVNHVTLAYPQIVSLKALESFLQGGSAADPVLKDAAMKDLVIASQSKVPTVRNMAQKLLAENRF